MDVVERPSRMLLLPVKRSPANAGTKASSAAATASQRAGTVATGPEKKNKKKKNEKKMSALATAGLKETKTSYLKQQTTGQQSKLACGADDTVCRL